MTKLVEFRLDEGQVLVEVEEVRAGGLQSASRGGVGFSKATEAFDAALANVKPIAEAVFAQLGDLVKKPEEVQVEFGVKLTAGVGVVVAKASTEGHIKISIKWKP